MVKPVGPIAATTVILHRSSWEPLVFFWLVNYLPHPLVCRKFFPPQHAATPLLLSDDVFQ